MQGHVGPSPAQAGHQVGQVIVGPQGGKYDAGSKNLVPTCLDCNKSAGASHENGEIVYWHVDDVKASFDRLVSMGATVHDEPVERGPGFVTASVVDPFGNVLGVMCNQHYLDMLPA